MGETFAKMHKIQPPPPAARENWTFGGEVFGQNCIPKKRGRITSDHERKITQFTLSGPVTDANGQL